MSYLKVNRTFTFLRKYSWIFIVVAAFGGLFINKLGLLIIPLMILVMIFGLFKKKYWCGNICPHGSLFDYVLYPISANKRIAHFFKSKITSAVMFTIFMFAVGFRLYNVLNSPGTDLLNKIGMIFVANYLVVTLVGGLLAVTVNPRAWCTFCPMGTMQDIMHVFGDKLTLNKNTVQYIKSNDNNNCVECKKCEKVCPMQIPVYNYIKEKNYVDNINCINCKVCTYNCPLKILTAD